METIIASCISAAVTLIVCLINNNRQQIRNEEQQKQTREMLDYKLSELTKRVDKHNNVIERTYQLEQTISVHGEQIKVANHRIEDLEKKGE